MPLIDPATWNRFQEINSADPYSGTVAKVASEVAVLLDGGWDFACKADIVDTADRNVDAGGITGFMANAAIRIVIACHSRGDELANHYDFPLPKPGVAGDLKRRAIKSRARPAKEAKNGAVE